MMKRVMGGFFLVLLVYMALSLLYTYILFPNLSVEHANVISGLLK